MTEKQEKALVAGSVVGLGLLVWWLWPKGATKTSAGGPRKSSELVIDDDVYSPNFGLPVYGPAAPAPVLGPVYGPPASLAAPVATSPDMQRLIDASNAAIAADDAANKG